MKGLKYSVCMWLGPFLTVHFLKRAVSKAEVHLYTAKVHLFKLAASKLMDKKYGGPMIFISVDISKSLVCFFTVERFIVKEDENQSLTLSRFCWFLLSCHWKEKTVTIQYVQSGLQDLINVWYLNNHRFSYMRYSEPFFTHIQRGLYGHAMLASFGRVPIWHTLTLNPKSSRYSSLGPPFGCHLAQELGNENVIYY